MLHERKTGVQSYMHRNTESRCKDCTMRGIFGRVSVPIYLKMIAYSKVGKAPCVYEVVYHAGQP